MLERAKISDIIYIKHGIKDHELAMAVKEFGLDKDEDFSATVNALQEKLTGQINQMRKGSQLSEEELAIVKMVCDEAGPVNSASDMTGFMDFEEYLKVFTALIRL